MLNEILNAVLDSLVMVSSFGIFMLFCAFSNSILSRLRQMSSSGKRFLRALLGISALFSASIFLPLGFLELQNS